MVAYKEISPRGTDLDVSKLESKDLLESTNQKLASSYFSYRSRPFYNSIE